MGSRIKFLEKIEATLRRAIASLFEKPLKFKGRYFVEHERDGKIIGSYLFENVVVNEGKNLNLDVAFGSVAKPTWYMGIFDDTGGGGNPTGTDTMTSHAGWNEMTGYSSATRPAWGPGAAASQSITNGTPVAYAITATANIKGSFITSNSTKGATTGTLWSAGTFSTIAVISGDTLRLTYTLTIA